MGGGGGVGGVGGGGGIPSNYLVSTQLQLWLFCCWGLALLLGCAKNLVVYIMSKPQQNF